jgi:hypothetical protein
MNQPSSKSAQSLTESVVIGDIRLDCDYLLIHAGGDPELLLQLCDNFLRELPTHMESLHTAIKERNHLAAGRAVQRLRNCLIVFGSGAVCLTAEALEGAVHARRVRQAAREWKRLESQLYLLVPQVQRLMLEMSTPRTPLQ